MLYDAYVIVGFRRGNKHAVERSACCPGVCTCAYFEGGRN